MPHRVPFDNALARLCGLGDLDKLEREQKMRQAHRYYNRPQHPIRDDRALEYYNHSRHPHGIPPFPYPHHQPFIGNGLDPNPHTRRRQAEEHGQYYPGPGQRTPARRPLGRHVDDWDSEQVNTYYYYHEKDIKLFQRRHHRLPNGRLTQYSKKGLVRRYHEYIQSLVDHYEHQGRGHGGRGMAPRGRYQIGEGYDEDDDVDEDDFDD